MAAGWVSSSAGLSPHWLSAASHSSAFLYRALLIFLSAFHSSLLLSTNSEPLTWEKAHAAGVFSEPQPAGKSLHRPRDTCKMLCVAQLGSCCTKLEHSHLFCRLCTAQVTSLPVAIHASHARWQIGRGLTKGQRAVFLRARLQPITPQQENKGNLGWLSYTSEVFSQKMLHTWYLLEVQLRQVPQTSAPEGIYVPPASTDWGTFIREGRLNTGHMNNTHTCSGVQVGEGQENYQKKVAFVLILLSIDILSLLERNPKRNFSK